MSGILTALCGAFAPAAGGAIPTVTQSVKGSGANTAVTNTITSVTGRNLYAFCNSDPSTTSITLTDTFSNSWTAISSGTKEIWAWKKENATGGASHAFTFTPNTTGLAPSGVVIEVSGAAASGSLELYAESSDGATPFTNSITTSSTNRLLIDVINTTDSSPSTNVSYTASGWTLIQEVVNWNSVYPIGVFRQDAATATTYNASFTDSGGLAIAADLAIMAIHA